MALQLGEVSLDYLSPLLCTYEIGAFLIIDFVVKTGSKLDGAVMQITVCEIAIRMCTSVRGQYTSEGKIAVPEASLRAYAT